MLKLASPGCVSRSLSPVRTLPLPAADSAAARADSAAARVLAAGADRDVSEVRAELRAHTQASTPYGRLSWSKAGKCARVATQSREMCGRIRPC
jgi:hypothetical protein